MPTFLFTDIEGSTRLWEEHGDAMATALARHDQILHEAVSDAGGEVLKTTGDGMIAVFDSLPGTLTAAIEGQQALGREPWGETGPIRVRMGIHSGVTESREGDFFGPAMNRAARIMAAGHGGQVLVSGTAADSAPLPAGVSLRDLGMHRLKDLTEPEHLFQVMHEGLRADFPAPRTLDGRPHNLPRQTTEFLGRAAELEAIHVMLGSPTTRLLTITGPGGAGKTRIALQVAAEELDSFPDGVFFVDLSAVRDPDAVFDVIAQTLDISLSGGSDALEMLETRLRDARMMLVLDNFEQVTAAAVGLSDLLQRAPGLKVVVTSRETLRVRAEKVYPVPPLSLARPQDPPAVIAESEAVALFVDRARAVRPDFAITAENASTIAEVCLRLDGLPLAIELAAARLNVFSPSDLLDRLRERLDVLGAGGRDLPDRQRTLWGAIGWSYELLDQTECEVFELLSVFSTSDLRAIETVASEALGSVNALDTLSSLVDKSLVRTISTDGSQRFSMLQMIKEFAASKLAETPESEEAVRDAHATYFCRLAATMAERLHGPDRQTALQELGEEIGNLRTAWEHWVAQDDAARVMGMIEGMWAFHESRGWYRAAIDLAEEAIGVLDRAEPTPELAADQLGLRMSLARGMMALRGYGPETEEAFRRAIEMSENVGTPAQRFPVLRALATYHMGIADFAGVAELGRQLLELGEEAGDESMLIEGHYVHGTGLAFTGDLENGLPHVERAIEMYDPKVHDSGRFRLGPNTGVVARTASGLILWDMGELQKAVDRLTEALEVARQMGHPYSICYGLHHNGLFALYRHHFDDALARSRELAQIAEENEYLVWATLAAVVEGVATTLLGDPQSGLGMTERAIELYQGLTAPPVFWSDLLRLRAWVHGAAGQPERGLELMDEALALVGGEEGMAGLDFAVTKAELLRMLSPPDFTGAEQRYRALVDAAAASGMRFLQLRGLTGLVDVRRALGIIPDGSDELAALLETFPAELEEYHLVRARETLAGQFTASG
ncbi:MAG TPA: adenylate/guanylate cyclase domain-containing protein [Acidimicrobiia bacterium]|nr:adenylate/guanylate cyclase domain-containing protein [Acidimicrobiia bacterium]